MGITVCRCCGGPIGKEEAAYDTHVCKMCQWFLDDLPPYEKPAVDSAAEGVSAPAPQSESSPIPSSSAK